MKQKKKILLVDDNEFIRIYFQDVLWLQDSKHIMELTVAKSIGEAEQLVGSPKTMPDIVFLDLAMPMIVDGHTITTVETGFSLLKKIKENPKTQHIKVIMFTGYDTQEYKDRATQLGADGYLVKSENMPRELIKFIEDLIT
jgi:CheY-like chemotaxis protein